MANPGPDLGPDAEQETQQRTALVVLGMHRSGTSALAGVLATMGAAAPHDPLAAEEMNPAGFFESAGLTQLDDQLMLELGTPWFDWRPLPEGWAGSAITERFRTKLAERLAETFGNEDLFVLKDPRVCRLAPLWLELLRAHRCRPVVVSVHRPPQDVAASLQHWAGYDPAYGRLLWLRYVLEGERATRHETRVFCSYRQLVDDWRSVVGRVAEAGDLRWPRRAEDVGDEVGAFLQKRARTPRAELADGTPLSPWEQTVFDILEAWAADGEDPADHARLDAVSAALEETSLNLGGVVDAGRAADIRRQELATTTAELENVVRGLRSEVQAADEALRTQGGVVEQQAAKIARLVEESEQRRDEVDRLARECRVLERQASAEMRERIEESFAEIRRLRALVARREAELTALAGHRDEILESHSWRATGPMRAVTGLARRAFAGEGGTAGADR